MRPLRRNRSEALTTWEVSPSAGGSSSRASTAGVSSAGASPACTASAGAGETDAREASRSGLPRAVPVTEGLAGQRFWVIAEHDYRAAYLRSIQADPQARVKMRQGWRVRWLTGTAQVLPDDDPLLRRRVLCRWCPGRRLNALVVRIPGTDLLTVRIDLEACRSRNKPGGHDKWCTVTWASNWGEEWPRR